MNPDKDAALRPASESIARGGPPELDFEEIYRRFQPRIRRYLARRMDERDADDVTQTVFLKVSQALAGFRGESSLATWIYRIATRAAADRLRSPLLLEMAHPISEDGSFDSATGAAAVADDRTPPSDRVLMRQEMNICIRGVVDELPQSYREVLTLSEFDGLKDAEIAHSLGLTLETAKIRFHRARAKLRKALQVRCDFYHDECDGLSCDPKGSS